jgi:uncharacterized membrane protein YiaA
VDTSIATNTRRAEPPAMTDTRYASRKFLLACAAFVAGLVFFSIGKIDAAQWLSQSAWVVGLYLAGNVADQAVTRT